MESFHASLMQSADSSETQLGHNLQISFPHNQNNAFSEYIEDN